MSRQYNSRDAHSDKKAGCDERGCKPSCCENLLAQLGVADPGNANFYDILVQLIGDTNIDIDAEIPFPDRTVFVSPDWEGNEDEEHTFLTLQAAADFAGALATAALPWDIHAYAGVYGALILPPHVNLIGEDKTTVSLASFSYAPGATTVGADNVRVANVTILGDISVDSSAKADLNGSQIEFDNIFTADASVVTLVNRSSAAGVALLSRDQISFRRSDVNGASLDFSVPAPVVGPGVLLFDNSFLTLSGALTILGAAFGPQFAARTIPGRRAARGRRGAKITDILPAAPTVSAAFFFLGEFLQAASASITNSNTLIQAAIVDSSVTGTLATYSISGGVYNNAQVSYTADAALAVGAGTIGALVHSAIAAANLSGAGALDRTISSGSVAASVLTDPTRFGAVIAFTPAYVNPNYSVTGTVVSATAVATPVVPTLQVTSAAGAELALSTAALAVGATVSWVAIQDAQLIPFI